MTSDAREFQFANLHRLAMTELVAHDGKGRIRFCRVASRAKNSEPLPSPLTRGACNFIDYSILPVGTAIGRHTHRDNEEEFYLIFRGRGRYFCNGQTMDVGPGDLVRNPPGGTHGLENIGAEELALFVFEVEVPQ